MKIFSKPARPAASPADPTQSKPEQAGRTQRLLRQSAQNNDLGFYLLVAVIFLEMIVGVAAFFYGIMHAAPQSPGGPPLARFPLLGWAVAAVLAPVGLLLLVHLTESWLSRDRHGGFDRAGAADPASAADADAVPERLQRFYAMVRNAPSVVVLLGILLLGAALFFVEGAFSALMQLGGALTAYIPWLAGSLAALLAVCYLGRVWLVYRRQRLEQEYAYRREVLERTGIILVDKGCVPLPQNEEQRRALSSVAAAALPEALVVESRALPAAEAEAESPAAPAGAAAADPEASADSAESPAKPAAVAKEA